MLSITDWWEYYYTTLTFIIDTVKKTWTNADSTWVDESYEGGLRLFSKLQLPAEDYHIGYMVKDATTEPLSIWSIFLKPWCEVWQGESDNIRVIRGWEFGQRESQRQTLQNLICTQLNTNMPTCMIIPEQSYSTGSQLW